VGESSQKEFILLFGSILRLRNILHSFDDFNGSEILVPRDLQDYQSVYLNLYQDFRDKNDSDKEAINDDVVFEIELIKQVEINVDYILMLVHQYRAAKGDGDDKEIRATIERAINSSPSLRNKRDLIEAFVDSLTATSDVDTAWPAYMASKRIEELDRIIADEGLDPEATKAFVEAAFRDGSIQPTGTAVTKILPPVSRFTNTGAHSAKKQSVLGKLTAFLERFIGLG
jgi:type I restriction enzyme R subunit